MRIEQFRIDGFGRLQGLETGSLGPLVVVVGPNEAGKSTLFSFLTTALYGFSPASRERNPHVPWQSDEAGGSVRIRLSDNRCAVVERKLRSSPIARLSIDGVTNDLRNQPVPWVDHIPRAVFRQVFAVTLAELAGLDEATWAKIQDRVLGSMGASDLRSPRAVADALEQEAREIWRPSRRGNQRLRDLREEGRALRLRRAEALDRDRQIRSLVEEYDTVLKSLEDARAVRQRDKISLDLVNELLPIKRQLERIEQLRLDGGDSTEIAGLPVQLSDAVKDLGNQISEARLTADELERDSEGPRKDVAALTDHHRALLSHEREIDVFLGQIAAFDGERAVMPSLRSESGELGVQLETAAAHLFASDAPPSATDTVQGIPLDLLLDRVSRLEAARRTESASQAGEGDRTRALLGLVLASVGTGLIAWGWTDGPTLAIPAGIALVVLGGGIALLSRNTERVGQSDGQRDGLESEIRSMLADVPLRDDLASEISPSVVQSLRRIQELGSARASSLKRLDELRGRESELDEAAGRLAEALGVDVSADRAHFAAQLRIEAREAARARLQADAATREIDRLSRSADKLRAAMERLDGERAALMQQVFRVTGRTDAGAIAEVEHRLRAHESADRLEEELRRQHDDLDDRIERIRLAEAEGSDWAYRAEEIVALRTRIETLDAEIETLAGRSESLSTEVNHLRAGETVDAVDGAILGLREREVSLSVARDRKWVLAQIIREADRSFREKHQPDLVRRASEHLENLTEGRYTGLLIDELGDGDLFQVVGPGLPKPIPLAAPISTGTLEQAYLSIRLAIIDHLDHGSERLPLFIDEAFANWDGPRRERGFDVLREISETRQVFAFTCHPHMARHLEDRGARVLSLTR